ncbi:MAG TPA: ion channel [Solirubrobacteraceae bacterium]|jgi:hypothetical protein|nr:ion channel [Solirubrobacteraceae bacterium]
MARRRRGAFERAIDTLTDRYGLVLVLLVVTYVLASALPTQEWVAIPLTALQGVTVVVTLAASGTPRRRRRVAIAAATLAVLISLVTAIAGGRLTGASGLIDAVLLFWALGAIVRRVAGHIQVTGQTLLGAMCCYVMFGLIYTFIYQGVARLQTGPFLTPAGSHTLSDYLFFSFTTLTTTGYGDLVPATGLGRALSMLEALSGQLFLVTVVARLVALWLPRAQRGRDPGS